MKTSSSLRPVLILSGAIAALLAVPAARATTYYWDTNAATPGFGTATSGAWAQNSTTTGRWTTDSAGSISGSLTQVTDNNDVFNFGTATLALGPTTITVSTVTMGNTNFNAASGAVVLTGGTITYAAAPIITVNNATDTINSIIAGAATSFTKSGTGALLLGGPNTYAGVTNLNQGVIQITNGSALGTTAGNTVVASGAELFIGTSSLAVAEAFNIAGTGTTGAIHIGGSAIGVALSGAITLSANARIQGDGSTVTTLSGGINTAGFALTFNGAGTTTVSTNPISGSGGSVTKSSGGVLTLSAANTYSGSTTINGGTLVLGNVNALQNTSGILMAAATTLQSNINGATVTAPITLSGTGNVSLSVGAASALQTNLNGAIGGTTSSLTFTTAASNLSNATLTMILGATGNYAGNTTITTGDTNNRLTVLNGVNDSLPATTVLTMDGGNGSGTSGRQVLYDLNGYNQTLAGLTNITTRTSRFQRVTNTGALATLTVNNSADFAYGGLFAGTVVTDAQITGAIALTKNGAGKFTLAAGAGNSFTGNTKVLGGILSLGHATSIQSSALDTLNSVLGDATNGLQTTVTALTMGGLTGNKNLADVFTTTAGGYSGLTALTLNPGADVTNSYSADIGIGNGSLTLAKIGAGTQVLAGANTHPGATTVTAGELMVTGSLSGTANVNVGNATDAAKFSGTGTITTATGGALTVANNATLAPGLSAAGLSINAVTSSTLALQLGSSLELSIANSTPAAASISDYAKLTLGAGVSTTIAGQILTTGLTGVKMGDLFTVILNSGGAVSGTFSNAGANLVGGSTYAFNSGGQEWLINYAYTGATTATGIDSGDFAAITGGTNVALLAIPEPGALVSLLGGFVSLLGFHRRRRA